MTIDIGAKLGPYEIVELIGAGGMGEVYRARDPRLGRDVAVKVLPESFARDAERMRRFEQEARAIAALNHPHVVAVFDTGTHEGVPYLVSELLEGETLRDRLKRESIPSRRVIEYSLQIADGLAAAHDKGIVHRDLKPENLFLTSSGRVKILDFGLAKLERPDADFSATVSMNAAGQMNTAAGMVIGTAAYMSPEQVRGQLIDHRSDLFSFGAVLYEMLTGNHAFSRDSAIETMNAILKEDPAEIDTAQMKVSPGLERIVRHSLEKDPADRFQSARDLGFALGALTGTNVTAAQRAAEISNRRTWPLWLAGALALIALAALVFVFKQPTTRAERLQFAIPVPGEVSYLALSADGSLLAFIAPDEKSGVPMLHVQRVGSPASTVLPSTEGASFPFWSPDDAYIGFFATGKLQKIAASGGPPQVLTNVTSARGGSWGKKNVIVYAPDASGWLWRVNADGTAAAPLTARIVNRGDQSHRWPLFLPDGDHFLFWAGNFDNLADTHTGIYLASLAANEKKLVTLAHSNAGYAPGTLFYVDDKRQLVAAPFDVSKAALVGESRVVSSLVGFQPSTYWGVFTAAENGTVVYNDSAETARSVLTWFDRTGKELGEVGGIGVLANPMLSPDDSRVAVDMSDLKANNVDVWIEGLTGGNNARFTFEPAEEVVGVWSRDGKSIVYRSAANVATLLVKATTGLEREKSLFRVEPGDEILPNSWTLDDKQILCTMVRSGGASGVRATDLVLVSTSSGEMTPFLATNASENNGQISPDGKWAAYASNESGDWEIYVTSFPGAAGKWQVSRGGGTEPRWSANGKEVFYIGPTGMLMAVSVSVGSEGTFSTGTPSPLFQIHGRPPISSTDLFTYDVTKDGTRFLVNRFAQPDHVAPLNIVLNATVGK